MEAEELEKICSEVLESYPDKVNNYRLGAKGLLGLFMGEVMKRTKNEANPEQVSNILKVLLNPQP